jgi:hypothetical protein
VSERRRWRAAVVGDKWQYRRLTRPGCTKEGTAAFSLIPAYSGPLYFSHLGKGMLKEPSSLEYCKSTVSDWRK